MNIQILSTVAAVIIFGSITWNFIQIVICGGRKKAIFWQTGISLMVAPLNTISHLINPATYSPHVLQLVVVTVTLGVCALAYPAILRFENLKDANDISEK